MTRPLSLRRLNRATLARQQLLERSPMAATQLIEHLVGLQAQEPRDPYVGLWSRLVDFDAGELEQLLVDRAVVRLTVQRGTVHAVTADDARVLRPLAQPLLRQQLHTHRDYAPLLQDVDLAPVMAYATKVLATPHNTKDLRAALDAEFPEHDAAALTFACRNLLPFVQVPPRGLWSRGGQVVGATLKGWTGRDVFKKPSVDDVMLRYLAAFGPATVADAATWSRYTGLREVFERLRPKVRTWTGEDGREYFDVPDAPMPDEDVPAPVRFLPQYDNVMLSHKDRSRFVDPDEQWGALWLEHRGFVGSLTVDGMLAGSWRVEQPKSGPTTLRVTTARRMSRADAAAVEREAGAFLAFIAPDRAHNYALMLNGG